MPATSVLVSMVLFLRTAEKPSTRVLNVGRLSLSNTVTGAASHQVSDFVKVVEHTIIRIDAGLARTLRLPVRRWANGHKNAVSDNDTLSIGTHVPRRSEPSNFPNDLRS
jgi:hypothetical protein